MKCSRPCTAEAGFRIAAGEGFTTTGPAPKTASRTPDVAAFIGAEWKLRQRALAPRRLAEEVAIAFGKVRSRDEAAGQRHIDHRHVGLQQQQTRPVQAKLDIIACRRTVEILAEHPLLLADRESGRP